LASNYEVKSYNIETGFRHFAIAIGNISKLVEDIQMKRGNIKREPSHVKQLKGRAWQ